MSQSNAAVEMGGTTAGVTTTEVPAAKPTDKSSPVAGLDAKPANESSHVAGLDAAIASVSEMLEVDTQEDFRNCFHGLSERLRNDLLKELGVPVGKRLILLRFLAEKPEEEEEEEVEEEEQEVRKSESDMSPYRGCCNMFVFIFGIIPALVLIIAVMFGGILAVAEDWSFREGFEYVVGNLVGLATPLTDVSPDNLAGELLDILVAVWSLSLAGVAIGFIGSFSFVETVSEYVEGRTFTDNTDILTCVEIVESRLNALTTGEDSIQNRLRELSELVAEANANAIADAHAPAGVAQGDHHQITPTIVPEESNAEESIPSEGLVGGGVQPARWGNPSTEGPGPEHNQAAAEPRSPAPDEEAVGDVQDDDVQHDITNEPENSLRKRGVNPEQPKVGEIFL